MGFTILDGLIYALENQVGRARVSVKDHGFKSWLDVLTQARKENLGLVAEVKEAWAVLESLTPGGSEFVGDPRRCAEFVRARLAMAGKIAAERNKLRAALQAEHSIMYSVVTARTGSIGSLDNVYLPQIDRDRADDAIRLGDDALKGDSHA